MAIIKIDPLNRIEGHVKVEVEVGATGIVAGTNVKVAGTMFRGFENIMAKRDPRDVPVLIQRI
jgi:hydrogenase large subunit